MKIMLYAAALALTVGVASAHADGGIPGPNTMFTMLPGALAKLPPGPAMGATQNGQPVQSYVTGSKQGTWLFTPNGNAGSNS
jgi:hypothetical protein